MASRVILNGLRISVIVGEGVRARADQRHLAFEDVNELRQFVEAVAAQELAERGYARVVRLGLLDTLPVLRNRHGAEFVDRENLIVEAVTLLLEENRAFALQFDRNCDDSENRQSQRKSRKAKDLILKRLEEAAPAFERAAVEIEQRRRADPRHLAARMAQPHLVRRDRDRYRQNREP